MEALLIIGIFLFATWALVERSLRKTVEGERDRAVEDNKSLNTQFRVLLRRH